MKTSNFGVKIVTIGGGTGHFMLLSGLKNYVKNITALVSMADNGGSTGALRDDLGVLPPGDVRQCLVALAQSPRVRELFNYRFAEGSLSGHSFGNLFLAALEKLSGDFRKGVELAGEILRIQGNVEPLTLTNTTLMLDDGKKIWRGESDIESAEFNHLRPRLWLEPAATVNPLALDALRAADLIVLAPGGLYHSLGAALSVDGLADSLKNSRARKLYICNLINKPGQTDGFSPLDYADELERMAGCEFLDAVIYNTRRPSDALIKRYAREGETPLAKLPPNFQRHYKMIGADLLEKRPTTRQNAADKLTRTLIRHDSDLVARQIMKLYFD
ncbi:MAG: YvcK family protein [Candidatus Nomurabacteria bacterium]|jgi:uncharacterized cofD-like protein|nr:YvcK family protein [Candidatus Nomurabacteria bacterium]